MAPRTNRSRHFRPAQEDRRVTLDYGYHNTGSCESAITFLDGERGVLRYRGYPSKSLPRSPASWRSPTAHQRAPSGRQGARAVGRPAEPAPMMHEDMRHFFYRYPERAHPMAICPRWSSPCRPSIRSCPNTARTSRRRRSHSGHAAHEQSCAPSPRSRTRSRSASLLSTPATTSSTAPTS
jgi:citrate synthase